MSVNKPRPVMEAKRRVRGENLMDNQDTVHRGDGAARRVPLVSTTIKLPFDLKEEAQDFAYENGTSLTSLLIEGLRWRLEQR